jgi:hypothetical protein
MKRLISRLVYLPCLSLLLTTTCDPEDVGVPCKLDLEVQIEEEPSPVFKTPAMECRSRICLAMSGIKDAKPLCTRPCESNSDCPDGMDTCKEGFSCIIPVQMGSLSCCKMCVCNRFITSDDSTADFCASHPNSNCPKPL